MELSHQEELRYNRQIVLKDIDFDGQEFRRTVQHQRLPYPLRLDHQTGLHDGLRFGNVEMQVGFEDAVGRRLVIFQIMDGFAHGFAFG